MKHFSLILFVVIFQLNIVSAAAGFFGTNGTFAIVNGDFHDLNATTSNPDFSGASLGSFAADATFLLGGQARTFKNNGTDVTGVTILYRYYPTGSPTGTFSEISYSFQWNNGDSGAPSELGGAGDQQWGTDIQGANMANGAINIFAGVTPAIGNYTLEIFTRLTTDGTNSATEIFESNGGSNYSASFTITAVAPVEFSGLYANSTKDGNHLHFSTATETGNAYFSIERSTDSRRWKKLGQLAGVGTTQQEQQYDFLDATPLPGTNYYRIKQVDFDDTFNYSKIVSVRWNGKLSVQLFPNPVTDVLQITGLPDTDQSLTLEVIDVAGRRVLRQNWNQATMDVSFLAEGLYWLRISIDNSVVEQLRFLK